MISKFLAKLLLGDYHQGPCNHTRLQPTPPAEENEAGSVWVSVSEHTANWSHGLVVIHQLLLFALPANLCSRLESGCWWTSPRRKALVLVYVHLWTCRVKNTWHKEKQSGKRNTVLQKCLLGIFLRNKLELNVTPAEIRICLPRKTTGSTDFT